MQEAVCQNNILNAFPEGLYVHFYKAIRVDGYILTCERIILIIINKYKCSEFMKTVYITLLTNVKIQNICNKSDCPYTKIINTHGNRCMMRCTKQADVMRHSNMRARKLREHDVHPL